MNKGILAGSLVLAAIFLAVAFIWPHDDSPPPSGEANYSRKSGSMRVYWYGHYRSRSGRLESTGNRSYMGGGLHGGK